MKALLFAVALLGCAACASAQTYAGFAWTITGVDQPTASAFHYKIVIDGAAPALLVNASCAGVAAPWVCSGVTPTVVPPGKHVSTLITFLPDETAQSDPSDPLTWSQGPPKPSSLAPKK